MWGKNENGELNKDRIRMSLGTCNQNNIISVLNTPK